MPVISWGDFSISKWDQAVNKRVDFVMISEGYYVRMRLKDFLYREMNNKWTGDDVRDGLDVTIFHFSKFRTIHGYIPRSAIEHNTDNNIMDLQFEAFVY